MRNEGSALADWQADWLADWLAQEPPIRAARAVASPEEPSAALYLLVVAERGRVEGVLAEAGRLAGVTAIARLEGGPYDALVRAAGRTHRELREDVLLSLSKCEGVARILVCPVVGARGLVAV